MYTTVEQLQGWGVPHLVDKILQHCLDDDDLELESMVRDLGYIEQTKGVDVAIKGILAGKMLEYVNARRKKAGLPLFRSYRALSSAMTDIGFGKNRKFRDGQGVHYLLDDNFLSLTEEGGP